MVSELRTESWCFMVHHSHLWRRHTIFLHCLHFNLFFLLSPRWSPEWALLIHPLQLLFSQERLVEPCTGDE